MCVCACVQHAVQTRVTEPTEVAQPSAVKLRNATSERLGNNLGDACSLFHMWWGWADSSGPASPSLALLGTQRCLQWWDGALLAGVEQEVSWDGGLLMV